MAYCGLVISLQGTNIAGHPITVYSVRHLYHQQRTVRRFWFSLQSALPTISEPSLRIRPATNFTTPSNVSLIQELLILQVAKRHRLIRKMQAFSVAKVGTQVLTAPYPGDVTGWIASFIKTTSLHLLHAGRLLSEIASSVTITSSLLEHCW